MPHPKRVASRTKVRDAIRRGKPWRTRALDRRRRIPMAPVNENANVRGGAPSESDQPIRFAGSVLGTHRHVCAFFNSADEEYRVMLPFIKDGFERGERAFHIVDPALRAEHLRRFESANPQNTPPNSHPP